MEIPKLRMVLFASANPREIIRLASKILKEVPDATWSGIVVCGKVVQPASGAGSGRWLSHQAKGVASFLLRLVHACPANPNGTGKSSLEDLVYYCEKIKCLVLMEGETRPNAAIEVVRELRPDLGVIMECGFLDPHLCKIPRLGSVRVGIRGLSEGGGDALEFVEAAGGRNELEIGIHHLDQGSTDGKTVGSVTLPIEPFDTPESLKLKAKVLANDLLVRSIAAFAAGSSLEKLPGGSGKSTTACPQEIPPCQQQVLPCRTGYELPRGRPAWKLLLRTALLVPLTLRNWLRRWRESFPVVIFFHHLVSDCPHRMAIPTALFFRQVQFLKKYYKIASLDEAVTMLREKKVKVPTVVLTFDDGYKDNFLNMRSVTEELDIPLTLFVCTDHVTEEKEFTHDLESGIKDFFALNWEQVLYLSQNGYTIGTHTRTHYDCGSTDAARLRTEIAGSRADLEGRLGCEVNYFAFPFGKQKNMSRAAVEIAKNTHAYFFSAQGGVNYPSPNGPGQHLLRCYHPNDLWELELAAQSVLEFS